MPKLSDLTTAIQARIKAAQEEDGALFNAADAVVLVEDKNELQREVDEAISQTGLVILIGMPSVQNTSTEFNPSANLNVKLKIGIGEDPTTWREPNCKNLVSQDVELIVIALLQNFIIPGFRPLKVVSGDYIANKKRQLYELAIETLMLVPKIP